MIINVKLKAPSSIHISLFVYLMAYQPSRVIQCQIHPFRRTVVVLFNPKMGG